MEPSIARKSQPQPALQEFFRDCIQPDEPSHCIDNNRAAAQGRQRCMSERTVIRIADNTTGVGYVVALKKVMQ